jgi:ribosomal protein L14E/L6E/L27E
MEQKFSIGDIVLSAAGRDKGRHFVIMSTEGIFAWICDGDIRKTDCPKKKKIKHLKKTDGHSQYIADKIAEESKVTNNELRRAISEFEEELNLDKDYI